MDFGIKGYTTGEMGSEMKEDLYLTEIKDNRDPTICFEECFVTGVPENYPGNTDDYFGSEEAEERHKLIMTSFADDGIVDMKSSLRNISEGQSSSGSNDQAKDSWESGGFPDCEVIKKVQSIDPMEWVDTDESDSESISRSSTAKCPMDSTDFGDDESEDQSLTEVARVKTNSKHAARKRRRLARLGRNNFDGAVAAATEDNKIWKSSTTGKPGTSDRMPESEHVSSRTKLLRLHRHQSAEHKSDDLLPESVKSPVQNVDSNSETSEDSVASCEKIPSLPSHPKKPLIISNSRNNKVSFIDKLKTVEEDGLQPVKRTKIDRRKQVIVFKPDSVFESDVSVTDSEDENGVVLIDSGDEVQVVLTDTDDEAEIVYDNDGSSITCNICYKTFDSRSVLTLHKRTHNGTQSFQCLECDVKFSTEFGLECHFCEQDNLSFVCKQCKVSFASEWDAISHECADGDQMQTQRHSACKVCGLSFTRRLLLGHMAESHPQVVGQRKVVRGTELVGKET